MPAPIFELAASKVTWIAASTEWAANKAALARIILAVDVNGKFMALYFFFFEGIHRRCRQIPPALSGLQ
jgi:hypothetical protein